MCDEKKPLNLSFFVQFFLSYWETQSVASSGHVTHKLFQIRKIFSLHESNNCITTWTQIYLNSSTRCFFTSIYLWRAATRTALCVVSISCCHSRYITSWVTTSISCCHSRYITSWVTTSHLNRNAKFLFAPTPFKKWSINIVDRDRL